MRCVIDAEKPIYPVAWMCRMLGVPRSSFYAWRHQADTATATRRRLLAQRVAQVFADSRGTYGCRRVAAELNRRGDPARRRAGRGPDVRTGAAGVPAPLLRRASPCQSGRMLTSKRGRHLRRAKASDHLAGQPVPTCKSEAHLRQLKWDRTRLPRARRSVHSRPSTMVTPVDGVHRPWHEGDHVDSMSWDRFCGENSLSRTAPLPPCQHCPKCPCRQTRFRAEITSLASVVDRHCSPRSTVVCAAVWQSPSGR
jgi:hypothetical protein